MVEVNLKRTFSSGEWEKGVAIKDYVIIVEKVCPSKYKVATKTNKMEERKIIQTANIRHLLHSQMDGQTNIMIKLIFKNKLTGCLYR